MRDERDSLEHLAGLQAGCRPHGDAGRDAPLEPGDPDHEELIEVEAKIAGVAAALEERDVLVGGAGTAANCSHEISRSRKRSAGRPSSSVTGPGWAPAPRTKRPLDPCGW